MNSPKNIDYVLGTHDAEITRLQLQHNTWRPLVLACWQRAGIGHGQRVIDIGCGPGFASIDLAQTVGPQGHVLGLERSERFIDFARNISAKNALSQLEFLSCDVMDDDLELRDYDAIWCRWLACFVSSPARLVEQMLTTLKPGGKIIFHEYVHYETYQSVPTSSGLSEFVIQVMASWREFGGEPNVARQLPGLLTEAGAKIVHTRPISFSAQPNDPVWQWPQSFVDTNLDRLLELGRVDYAWTQRIREEMRALNANPNALLITPMVLEIIAEKQ